MPINKNTKYFLGIIILCAVIFFVLLLINVVKGGNKPAQNPVINSQKPTMMLSFIPNTISVTPGNSFSANIDFDTYGNPANGVKVVVQYDPGQIQNVRLIPVKDPTSALSYAFNQIAGMVVNDPASGTIKRTYVLSTGIPEQKGHGIIAKFTGKLSSGVKSAVVQITAESTASSKTFSPIVLGRVNLNINPQ